MYRKGGDNPYDV